MDTGETKQAAVSEVVIPVSVTIPWLTLPGHDKELSWQIKIKLNLKTHAQWQRFSDHLLDNAVYPQLRNYAYLGACTLQTVHVVDKEPPNSENLVAGHASWTVQIESLAQGHQIEMIKGHFVWFLTLTWKCVCSCASQAGTYR
jgi:hypothetical protein